MSDGESRVSYGEIKALALDAYYNSCRDNALMEGWSHRQVLGSVDYAFEGIYESKVENLMLCVVQLVLSGGWCREAADRMRNNILSQLSACDIQDLLHEIPHGEAEIFLHDLKILKLI